jgi:non-homologous end joining protein Ku
MDLVMQKARDQAPVEAPALPEEAGEGPADLVAALEESMRKVKSR